MRTRIGHSIRVAMLLGVTLSVWTISAQAQDIVDKGTVTGHKAPSGENNNKIDYKNAEAMPLPVAPDSLAK